LKLEFNYSSNTGGGSKAEGVGKGVTQRMLE